MSETYHSVAHLNPTHQKWPVKVRVLKKTDIISGTRCDKFFAMVLMDEDQIEIKASVFNEYCEPLDELFEVGEVYSISDAEVQRVNSERSSLIHDSEIILYLDSTKISRLDDDGTIPLLPLFDFSSMIQVKQMEPGTYAPEPGTWMEPDVKGMVKLMDETTQPWSSYLNVPKKKHKLLFYDETDGEEMLLLLYRQEFGELAHHLAIHSEVVVWLKGVRVVEDYSDNLKRALMTTSTTLLAINPESLNGTPRKTDLDHLPRKSSHNTPTATTTSVNKKSLAEIVDEYMRLKRPCIYDVKAKITSVKNYECMYRGCTNSIKCKTKVTCIQQDGDTKLYFCRSCETSSPKFCWKLVLKFEVSDDSNTNLQAYSFDQPMILQHLGKTMEELILLRTEDSEVFKQTFDNLNSQEFDFRLKISARRFGEDGDGVLPEAEALEIHSTQKLTNDQNMERRNPLLPPPTSPSQRDVSRPPPSHPVKRQLSFDDTSGNTSGTTNKNKTS